MKVYAGYQHDWELVHEQEPKPVLCCIKCDTRLIAKARRRDDGGETRFFAFYRSTGCDHLSETQGVARQTGEGERHAWVKTYVRDTARELGYLGAEVEYTLPGLRADVYVPEPAAVTRIEVQQHQTDFDERTEKYDNVLWLLDRTYTSDKKVKNALFTQRAVAFVVTAESDGTRGAQLRPVEPWRDCVDEATMWVRSTVLFAPAVDPSVDHDIDKYFKTRPMPLKEFLGEVLAGKRVWRNDIHRFAGWVRFQDIERYQAWRRSCLQAKWQAAEAHDAEDAPPAIPPQSGLATLGPAASFTPSPSSPSSADHSTTPLPPPPTPVTGHVGRRWRGLGPLKRLLQRLHLGC